MRAPITTAAEATPQRLSDALGYPVLEVEVRRQLEMPCSHLAFLRLNPGPNAQSTIDLVLKMADEGTEAMFFLHFAPLLPARCIPECFDVQLGEHGSHLLLRDYSASHETPSFGPDSRWPTTAQVDEFAAVARTFAHIHALTWSDWDLSTGSATTSRALPPGVASLAAEATLSASDIHGAFAYKPEVAQGFLHKMAGMLTAEEATAYILVAERVNAALQKRVVPGRHLCVTRQDTKPENILFPKQSGDGPIAIDFGALYLWFGPNDLAVLLNRFEPSFRREVCIDLLRCYHDTLQSVGISDYLWDECLNDYRLGTIQRLHNHIRDSPLEQVSARDLWRAGNVRRAFTDLNCAQLLE